MRYRNQPVTVANRDIIYPFHDIYSLGVLLRDLLSESEIKAKFEIVLGSNGMRALQLIQKRIQDSSPSNPYYTSDSLFRDWEKLHSDYLAPAGVPELSLAAEFKYAIATPLGRVVITPRLNFLASHKLFLRIGGIPQLELVRLKFAGATHSRLEHSALVLRNARYYLSHLLNGPVFRLLINQYELEATLILALLHDIGHYQLSHMFEDYASEQKRMKAAADVWQGLTGPAAAWKNLNFDIPSDDDLFVAAFDYLSVENLGGDYGKIIQRACENNARKHKLPLQHTLGWETKRHFSNETYEAVVAIHESVYRRKPDLRASHIALGGILSSGLDADKISYLMQDATETGVRFGLGIDIDGLLGSLRSPSPQDIEQATGPLLAINSKGIAAAESVLMARNLMYERVYWHPTNRAIIAAVKYCITRLLRSGALDFPSFLEDTFFESYDYALKHLYHMYYEKFRPSTTIPIAYVLDGERSIHREFLHYSIENKATGRDVAQRLLRLTVFDVAALEDGVFEAAIKQYPKLAIIPGDILLDVPAKDRSKPSGERGGSVLVYEGNSYGRGRRLDRVTPVASGVIKTHDTRSKVCRVFISRALLAKLEGRAAINFRTFIRESIAGYVGASNATAVIS
jgi:HD superfamily phosphohydrolase